MRKILNSQISELRIAEKLKRVELNEEICKNLHWSNWDITRGLAELWNHYLHLEFNFVGSSTCNCY